MTAPKPIVAINRYKADLRELQFLLFEQFKLGELLGKAPFEAWGEDEVQDVARPSATAGCARSPGPLNAIGDHEGCKLEDGSVKTPTGFKEAWKKLYEAGWKSIARRRRARRRRRAALAAGPGRGDALRREHRVQHVPGARATARPRSSSAFGTPEQKELYCTRMFGGTWGGTMCLTEPQAGSDVGSARTTATKQRRRQLHHHAARRSSSRAAITTSPRTSSTSCSRASTARPPGTKGLTLFIVPQDARRRRRHARRAERRHASARIEHKMGINGSATCVLNFGENGKCIGWPVGGEAKLNQGMPQMFKMMNGARIAVGMQGVGVASSAYLNALEYAQGAQAGLDHHALEGRDGAARADHRARRRAPHAARHEGARRRHPRARRQARAPPGLACARSRGKDDAEGRRTTRARSTCSCRS